jgi:hypothetical protein
MEVYVPISPPDDFQAARYSLFNSVNWLTGVDAHWLGGVQYDSDCTKVSITSSPCVSGSPDSTVLTKSSTFSHVVRGSRPFTIYSEVDCSAPGGGWENEQDRALMALTHSGPTQLEATFWTGSSGKGAPVFPNLTTSGIIRDNTNEIVLQPSSTIISGVPLDVVEGLGRLEAAVAACYDGLAFIHVPVQLIESLAAQHLCEERNGKLYTYAGNQLIVGQGYPGTGPDGSVPASGLWIRATSPVFGIKDTVRTFTEVQSFDRNVNTIKMIAEQTYLLGWRCCLAGVLVTTGGEISGTVNAAT